MWSFYYTDLLKDRIGLDPTNTGMIEGDRHEALHRPMVVKTWFINIALSFVTAALMAILAMVAVHHAVR